MTAKKTNKSSRINKPRRAGRESSVSPSAAGLAKKSKTISYVFSIVLLLIVIILSLGLLYLYRVNQDLRQPEVQKQLAEQANQKLLDKVAGIILVPADEKPTVAKIVNVANLKKTNPSFYEFARDGDHLIIYSSKAIIYREGENKIINVAPVVIKPGNQPGLESSSDKTGLNESNNTSGTLKTQN